MQNNLLLEGVAPRDPDDERAEKVHKLFDQIKVLEVRLDEAREEARKWHEKYEQSYMALTRLRRSLEPLYNALRGVFGDLAIVANEGEAAIYGNQTTVPQSDAKKVVWDQWKQRLGSACAKLIDALMVHGELTQTQLSVITGIRITNVPTYLSRMNKAGIVNMAGGRGGKYSLKQI